MRNALEGIEVVFNEIATVGVGQNQVKKCVEVNTMATTKLKDENIKWEVSLHQLGYTTNIFYHRYKEKVQQ